MSDIFKQMVSQYEARTEDEYANAINETMQQITLAGLYRGGFFTQAAFYGGTCLRIFYGLKRFSQDLDFSLLKRDNDFSLETYFESVIAEFRLLGRDVIINKKEKKVKSNVESAFLKDNTAVYDLQLKIEKPIKIKIEVDIDPPSGFSTEQKLLLLPFSFMTQCYTLPDLYAGKMHALLFRNWKNRVKGRDWFDFEWYARNNTVLNFNHLCQRAYQFGWQKETQMTQDDFKTLLKEKISKTDIKMVQNDVRPFIKNADELNIWSADYFLQLADMIRFA